MLKKYPIFFQLEMFIFLIGNVYNVLGFRIFPGNNVIEMLNEQTENN